MNKRILKKLLSITLILAMCLMMMPPVTAFAADTLDGRDGIVITKDTAQETTWTDGNGGTATWSRADSGLETLTLDNYNVDSGSNPAITFEYGCFVNLKGSNSLTSDSENGAVSFGTANVPYINVKGTGTLDINGGSHSAFKEFDRYWTWRVGGTATVKLSNSSDTEPIFAAIDNPYPDDPNYASFSHNGTIEVNNSGKLFVYGKAKSIFHGMNASVYGSVNKNADESDLTEEAVISDGYYTINGETAQTLLFKKKIVYVASVTTADGSTTTKYEDVKSAVAAAKQEAGCTVKIIAEGNQLQLAHGIYLDTTGDDAVTFDLNGHSLGGYPLNIGGSNHSGKVNIIDSSNGNGAIGIAVRDNGDVTFNGATATSCLQLEAYGGSLKFNGGNIRAFNLNNGITCKDFLPENYCYYYYSIGSDLSRPIKLADVTNAINAGNYVAVGACEHQSAADGACEYCGASIQALVTTANNKTTGYATLEEAINAAKENSGSTVKLTGNVNHTGSSIEIEKGTFTIDLNGQTLSYDGLNLGMITNTLINLTGPADVTIINSAETTAYAKITGEDTHSMLKVSNENAKLTIGQKDAANKLNFRANTNDIWAYSGSVVIYGGTFYSQTYAVMNAVDRDVNVTIYDGDFTGPANAILAEKGTVNIKGGTFKHWNTQGYGLKISTNGQISGGKFYGIDSGSTTLANRVASGSTLKKEDGSWLTTKDLAKTTTEETVSVAAKPVEITGIKINGIPVVNDTATAYVNETLRFSAETTTTDGVTVNWYYNGTQTNPFKPTQAGNKIFTCEAIKDGYTTTKTFTVTVTAPFSITTQPENAEITYGDTALPAELTKLAVNMQDGYTAEAKWYISDDNNNKTLIADKTLTANGAYGDDTFNTTLTSGTYSVYCEITVSKNGGSSYTLNSDTVTLTVKALPATIENAPTAKTGLTYNSEEQTLLNAGSGVVGGTLKYSTEKDGNYTETIPAGKNAGTYTIWYKVFGDDNHSDSEAVSVEVKIAPATITIIPDSNQSKIFGQDDPVLDYGYTGYYGRELPDFTGALSREQGEHTGTYEINLGTLKPADRAQTGFIAANYVLGMRNTPVYFTIDKADPTYTVPTGTTAVYGQTLAAVELPEGWSWVSPQTFVGDASSTPKYFKANYTPEDSDNYNTVKNIDVPVTVNAAKITPVVTLSATEFTYNGEIQKPAVTVKISDKAAALTENTDYTVQYSANSADADTYKVTISAISGRNFTFDNVEKEYAINQKEVTVNGIMVSNPIYDGSTKATVINSGQLTGAVEGDDLDYDIAAAYTDKNVGTDKTVNLTITLTGDKAKNYKLSDASQKTTTSSILAKDIALTGGIKATDRVYEADNTTVELTKEALTFDGLVENDKLDIVIPATGTIANADAENGKAVTYSGVTLTGADAANYNLTQPLPAVTVNITKADGDVVAPTAVADLVYGGSTAEQTLIAAGSSTTGTIQYKLGKNGEYSTELPKATAAGTYTVYYKVIGDNNHKNVEETSITAEIKKAKVTVKALDRTAYVRSEVPVLPTELVQDTDYSVSGLFDNDQLGGTLKLEYAETPDMSKTGQAVINISGADGGNNYDVVYESGFLNIKARSSGGNKVPYQVIVKSAENGTVKADLDYALNDTTVTVTATADQGYNLDTVTATDKDGNKVALTDKGNGKYTFTMPASEVTVTAKFTKVKEESPFADVSKDDYYYDAVKWASDKGITGGVGGNLFAPNDPCTRGQIVTFQWRAAGSPKADITSTFTDVASDAYYAQAVAWAIEQGITKGTSETTFSPEDICTRAHSVTFLWRAAGSPEPKNMGGFADVSADAYYAKAVAWAVENGITNGTGDGQFSPDDTCTRAQIVTLLYRTYGSK